MSFNVVHLLVGKVARQADLEGLEEGCHPVWLIGSEELRLDFHLQVDVLQQLVLLLRGSLALVSRKGLEIGADVQHEDVRLALEGGVLVGHSLERGIVPSHVCTLLTADLALETLRLGFVEDLLTVFGQVISISIAVVLLDPHAGDDLACIRHDRGVFRCETVRCEEFSLVDGIDRERAVL